MDGRCGIRSKPIIPEWMIHVFIARARARRSWRKKHVRSARVCDRRGRRERRAYYSRLEIKRAKVDARHCRARQTTEEDTRERGKNTRGIARGWSAPLVGERAKNRGGLTRASQDIVRFRFCIRLQRTRPSGHMRAGEHRARGRKQEGNE